MGDSIRKKPNTAMFRFKMQLVFYLLLFCFSLTSDAQKNSSFKVIAFYTARNDQAHISFVNEANKWFPQIARKYNFVYDSTSDWNNLNSAFLSHYQVVIFLDTRPDSLSQREAFQKYMENGGCWIGFHFAGFALTPSDYSTELGLVS